MTASVALLMPDDQPDMDAMSDDELVHLLYKLTAVTVECYVHQAKVIQKLEARGVDIDKLRINLVTFLRRIYRGQLLPEVLVQFGRWPMLVSKIVRLPIPDQRRLTDGKPVRLVQFIDGKVDVSDQDPSALVSEQVQQVFAADHIRTEAEQRNWLVARKAKKEAAVMTPSTFGGVTLDWEADTYRVGKHVGPFADLIAAVKAWEKRHKK